MLKSKINDQFTTSCFSDVGDRMESVESRRVGTSCSGNVIKYGKTKAGKQRYLCKVCKRLFVKDPQPNGYRDQYDFKIIQLNNEGLGIRSIARVLGVSAATVIRKILHVASSISAPEITGKLGRVQVDEVHTLVVYSNITFEKFQLKNSITGEGYPSPVLF